MPKYLFIQRSMPRTTQQKPQQPSRRRCRNVRRIQRLEGEVQGQHRDMGGNSRQGARSCRSAGATDGPFVESKEVVGGYMLVSAESIEQAIRVAKESPGVISPGSSVEIREIQGDAGLEQRPGAESCARPSAAPGLVEHFFRREYGRLVAVLTRRWAPEYHVVEDAGKAPAGRAHHLTIQGLPKDPAPGCIVWRTTASSGSFGGKQVAAGFWSRSSLRLLKVGPAGIALVSPERCATISCACFRLLR